MRAKGNGVLLQTRVNAKLAAWVARQAERSGLSVAAWLRANLCATRNAADYLRKAK